MIGITKVDRRPLTRLERWYLPEILRGMAVTFRHFWQNLRGRRRIPVIAYPEVREAAAPALRGRHRLMRRPDGAPKCVACMCCPTICPADCIHIVAEEAPDPTIEKRPSQFSIDYMRCVFCGLCVEACPVDAIRMDTGEIVLADYTREAFVFDIKRLLEAAPGSPAPPGQAGTGGLGPPPVPPEPATGPYYPSVFLDAKAAAGGGTTQSGPRLATSGEPRVPGAKPAPPGTH